MSVSVKGFTVGPLAENCWMLTDAEASAAVLVDPGDEPARLLRAVEESGCTLQAIWLTHAHFDHVGAVAGILRHTSVPVYLHRDDQPLYLQAANSARAYGLNIEQPPAGTLTLAEGDVLTFGTTDFTVWHLPGHAPGHVAFIGNELCMSGDVLFAGSVGRTDLPFADPTAMQRSLERMATLPPATRILAGHGQPTTIAHELQGNPFLRGLARPIGA